MVAKKEALIRGIDHQGVVGQTVVVEPVKHPPDVVVDRRDDSEVVLDVPLVSPADLVSFGQAWGHQRLEVDDRIEVHHPHLHRFDHVGATLVIIHERARFRNVDVVVQREVFTARFPRAVRRLVVAHQRKRPIRVSHLEPAQAVGGDQVGDVAASFDHLVSAIVVPRLQHHRVVIVALSR